MDKEDILQKYKASQASIYIILLIVFVAFSSFGLGRLSTIEKPEYKIIFPDSMVEVEQQASVVPVKNISPLVTSGVIVASKNGTKYHYPWCSGAKRTKEENKIWFISTEEARAAGYTPAANCKGLK